MKYPTCLLSVTKDIGGIKSLSDVFVALQLSFGSVGDAIAKMAAAASSGAATIYGYRYCRDDRQRRAAENMTKYSYDIAEIVEILNEFKVDMKLPGGSPRPLVSILLDVVRMYTQIHDPATGSRLLTLSESINQIITRCVENGMNQREITSEILCDPEVDDAQLDDFLHEFAIKEG